MFRKLTLFNNKILNKNYNIIKYLCSDQSLPQNNVITKIVNQYSNIKINNFKYNLKIIPYDLIECPDANLFRATLLINGNNNNNNNNNDRNKDLPPLTPPTTNIITYLNINQFDKDVVITSINNDDNADFKKNAIDEITFLLEIPIKSNLEINSSKNIEIENMYSDYLQLLSDGGNISTKNIQGTTFDICSNSGNISCYGLTLARKIEVRVRENGNLHMDKIQGDLMYAICDSGKITTNSCYVEASKFVTLNGKLHLKNVHKFSEIYLLEAGELNMTGFHGRLQAITNNGRLSFQFTELYGESIIRANNPEEMIINISEFVEDNVRIDVDAMAIKLNDNLSHLHEHLNEDCKQFRYCNDLVDLYEDKLTINTNSNITLGKMSWMDTIKFKM